MSEPTPMVQLAEEYLGYRRRLGFQLRITGQMLLEFARYADRVGHTGSLTTELAVCWARLPAGASPLYQARRLEVVRCFARHRAIFDPATEVPPERLLGSAVCRACSTAWGCKSPTQPDGGEVLAKRKGGANFVFW
jgi:hypothetical protein